MKRVFFALLLGSELGGTLLEATRAALGGEEAARRFRLPRAEGLHLTLLFLGDVEEQRLRPLWDGVAEALAGAAGPRLVLARTGAFPRRGRERVLFMGVREIGAGEAAQSGRLERLRRGVLAGARAAGCDIAAELERPFHAHVTLARPRATPAAVPGDFYRLAPELPWNPAQLALVESRRAPAGPPIYAAVERLQLAP